MSTQNLTNIVDVSVQVNPATSTLNKTLNMGLIVGTSTVIPDTSRVVEYTSTSDMLEKGWLGTEPEYKAAQIYFSQIPAPSSVAVGRQDTGASPAETAVQVQLADKRIATGMLFMCVIQLQPILKRLPLISKHVLQYPLIFMKPLILL